MKALIRTDLSEHLADALIGTLFLFGLMLPLCRALSLPVGIWHLALWCALPTLIFSLLHGRPALRVVSFVLALACTAALLFPHLGALFACFTGESLHASQLTLTLQIHAGAIVPALCVLIARLSIGMLLDNQARLLMFVYGFFLIVYLLFVAPETGFLSLIPLLLAFLLSLATCSGFASSIPRALPTAVLCLLIAALALPDNAPLSQPLSGLMQRTRQFMEDYFFFTQSREVYSLHMSGYQPYGHDRMGGAISPSDEPVMEVETPEPALLRGVVLNEYTGFSWQNTLSANRYLFVDPRFASLRRQTLNLSIPDADIRESSTLFTEHALQITLQKTSFSTLFVPARTSAISSQDGLVPYFSPSGEIFITRNLSPGDTYTLYAPLFTADSPGLDVLLQRAQQSVDPNYAEILATYGGVPDLVESEVYQLAYAVTQEAQTPFEKAQLLCDFLRTRYSYTYEQGAAPTDRDFVSWFLLDERQGYCVSFASALAVLGRIAGLPTRYIEGYVADPDADGIARVTELNAHAWVEIYFSGFGWVPFDPTPGSAFTRNAGDESSGTPPDSASDENQTIDPGDAAPTPTPSAEDLSGDDGASSLPTPEPTAEPTPTPTPTPDEGAPTPTPPDGTNASTPTPPPADAQPSPTPTPTPEPTPPVDPPPEDDTDPPAHSAPPLSWLLLIILVLFAIAARLYTSQPSFVARRTREPRAQLLIYYRAVLMLLSCMQLERTADESPRAHAKRVHLALDGSAARDSTGILRAALLVTRAQYSLHPPETGDVDFLQTVYIRVLRRMKATQLVHYFALRLIHGAGDWRKI